jgi:hypothetical protein
MSDRRSFLRGLVSLPLIGGGVTLIGQPAAAVPLVQAAALPVLGSPLERLHYAWEAFSSAARDLTAGADGWCILGGGERCTPLQAPYPQPSRFLRLGALHYAYEPRKDPARPFVYERHREIDLDGRGVREGWL